MNSGSESPKSDSPSPQPTLRGRKTLEGVCELANESAARLSALVAQVPNIPQPLAQQWEKQLKVLLNASCTEYKFALLGRTGSGKSTLTNCVLGAEILPTSAMRCVNGFARFKVSQLNFPSSCTAAITEVHYADSELVTAKISFVSHPVWEKEVKSLLKDISKKNADDKFAFKSLEKLVSVYPHLQGQDLSMVTHHQLSRCQPVNEYLGRTIRLPPTTQEDFRESLERYVSTTRTDSLALGNATSTLWPLVTKVQIFGKFDILSSGIILADLPGHGDDDAVRNAIATEYMKEADGAVLVADVKRVYSDHDTQKHLRDTLAQVLCDGRDPEDFVVLVATGCDTRIGDNEVPLSEESKIRVAALNEKLRETCQPSPLKRQKTSADSERRRGTSSEFRELEMEKAKIYAQTRNNFVRKSVQEPLQVYMRISSFSEQSTRRFLNSRSSVQDVEITSSNARGWDLQQYLQTRQIQRFPHWSSTSKQRENGDS
ncbi:Glycosyltransferase family 22 protein [Mycena kentingensis (nom. inval.)]|nr:Glycosyltransferase family 22 protein [Mycena kentingensis (nom. inval.)]